MWLGIMIPVQEKVKHLGRLKLALRSIYNRCLFCINPHRTAPCILVLLSWLDISNWIPELIRAGSAQKDCFVSVRSTINYQTWDRCLIPQGIRTFDIISVPVYIADKCTLSRQYIYLCKILGQEKEMEKGAGVDRILRVCSGTLRKVDLWSNPMRSSFLLA